MSKFRFLLCLLLLPEGAAHADPPLDVHALDQRVRILERLRELEKEASAEKAKQAATVGAGKDGFFLKSADGAYQLKLRGYLHVDGRFFLADDAKKATNTFFLRRVRPILEGTVAKIAEFRIMPDFGGGTTVLQDAYLNLKLSPALQVRAGKFKPPVGLERLASATDIVFVERSLPTGLVPNRDLGVQVHGELAKGAIAYAVGAFNGVVDGGNADVDTSDSKDLAARLFATPFKNSESRALQGLGLGIAFSSGDQTGTAASPSLAGFKSSGQQTFFSYRSDATEAGTTVANGGKRRISPQGYFYLGRFGVVGEYVRSSQDVKRDAQAATLDNSAWQVTGIYVVTGQKAGPKSIAPKKDFDPAQKAWGALELVARYSQLEIDADAFPVFADPKKAAAKASEWGVGANWTLSRNVKLFLDYNQTRYDGGTSTGDRDDEKAIFSRFQLAF